MTQAHERGLLLSIAIEEQENKSRRTPYWKGEAFEVQSTFAPAPKFQPRLLSHNPRI